MRIKAVLALTAMTLVMAVGPALAGTRSVKVGDNYFGKPGGETIHVSRGTTVRWTWAGANPHNVTVLRGPSRFHSGTMTTGSYSHRFTRAGTYTLYCTVHGASIMSMRVVVR